jgi:glycopeptide antibiotics resistance protein
VLAIAWIYVFTMVLGLTLAIEIGQKVSGSGTMSFADIVSGVLGFLYMFAVYALVRAIVHLVRSKRGRQPSDR